MKVRMKIGRLGDFLGIPAQPPFGHSVHPGDILDVTDAIGLGLIREGAAELKLDGPLGRPYQLTGMTTREFEALERKILGRPENPAPAPIDGPHRQRSRAEKDELLKSINW